MPEIVTKQYKTRVRNENEMDISPGEKPRRP